MVRPDNGRPWLFCFKRHTLFILVYLCDTITLPTSSSDMKKLYPFIFLTLLALPSAYAAGTDHPEGLSVWFDTPATLRGKAVWYGGHPGKWEGTGKPETAGDCAKNPDEEWESQSLPLGNGSIGANVMGSVETERITFNEKTLWR